MVSRSIIYLAQKRVWFHYIWREPHQAAAKISTYGMQFMAAKLDAIKRNGKKIFVVTQNYADLAEQIEVNVMNTHSLNTNRKKVNEVAG